MKRKIIYTLITIIWMIVIFTFSSMDKATRFYEEMIIQVGGKQWKNRI